LRRRLAARLGQSLIVVAIVTTISFFVIRLAPGDPFAYDSIKITPAIREQLRAEYGFDKPLPVQFVRYVTHVAHGEFGYSIARQQAVGDVLAEAVPRTLLLAGTSLVLSIVIGVVIGVLQAVHRGEWFDRASSAVLLFLFSLPDFWAALMIMLLFSLWWHVLPAGGIVDPTMHDYMSLWRAFLDRLQHLVLPVTSLTLLSLAGITRFQRAAMLEVLPSDFIRTARAKGVPERAIVWRHAFRTAITPIIVLLGLSLAPFLGGIVFVEKVFAWPGLGSLTADSIASHDYDVVTATVIVGAVLVVIGNLISDLLHMAFDPRVRE